MALFNDDYAFNSIIGLGSSVKGDFKVDGSVRIDGDLEGNLDSSATVNIGSNARIRGNITAKNMVVGGIIIGNLCAPESIKLLSTSVVVGDIQTKHLQADMDVIIHGHCISLDDENLYNEAVGRWQDTKAIAAKSILHVE